MTKDIASLYCERIFDRFGYLAAWLPGADVKIGDRGGLTGRLWSRDGRVPTRLLRSGYRVGHPMDDFEWCSDRGIEILPKAAGELMAVIPEVDQANAGLGIRFAKRGGIVIRASGITVSELDDPTALMHWMEDEAQAGRLAAETLVVTRVVRAECCSVFVGDRSGARVAMQVKASVDPIAPLAALDAGAVFRGKSGEALCLSMPGGSTPLFGGLKVSDRWLRGTRIEDVVLGDRGTPAIPELVAEPIEAVALP